MDLAWCSMLCDFGDWIHVLMRLYIAWSRLARHAATGASSVTACGTTTLLPIASGSWSSGSTGAKPKTCRRRATAGARHCRPRLVAQRESLAPRNSKAVAATATAATAAAARRRRGGGPCHRTRVRSRGPCGCWRPRGSHAARLGASNQFSRL